MKNTTLGKATSHSPVAVLFSLQSPSPSTSRALLGFLQLSTAVTEMKKSLLFPHSLSKASEVKSYLNRIHTRMFAQGKDGSEIRF